MYSGTVATLLKLGYKYVYGPIEGFFEWESEICKVFRSKINFTITTLMKIRLIIRLIVYSIVLKI